MLKAYTNIAVGVFTGAWVAGIGVGIRWIVVSGHSSWFIFAALGLFVVGVAWVFGGIIRGEDGM